MLNVHFLDNQTLRSMTFLELTKTLLTVTKGSLEFVQKVLEIFTFDLVVFSIRLPLLFPQEIKIAEKEVAILAKEPLLSVFVGLQKLEATLVGAGNQVRCS